MSPRPRSRGRVARDSLPSLRTGQPLPPVRTMTAEELHRELVDDAVAGVLGGERYLKRQVAAYMRIAKLRGQNPDDAFKAVEAEVIASGRMGMPVA